MFKVIALLRRKSGISRDEFIRHYETSHVPLALRVFPMIARYQRNYVDITDAIIAPETFPPDFDSITELWFETKADYQAMLAANADPDIGNQIAQDEEMFLDRGKTRLFIVEEAGGCT
jgi:uncharacterized protein (TIGR02118 family)